MSNPSIQFRGPFAYAWAVIASSLLAWTMWAPVAYSPSTVKLGLKVWCTVFFLLEMFGARRNAVHDAKGEPEVIRTLSQLLQRIGEMKETPYVRWWKGWSALVTGYVLTLGVAAGWAFWDVGPRIGRVSVVGVLVGLTVVFWNEYHQLRRYRYG